MWKSPFPDDYTYDGEKYEYTLMNPYCFEKDKSCIETAKSFSLVMFIVVAIVFACIAVCFCVV